MKNKKLKYILLPLVLLVWGLVIYKLFFEGGNVPENLPYVAKPGITNLESSESNYELIANYRDPFLKNPAIPKTGPIVKKEEGNENMDNLRRRRTTVSRVRWPEIKYGGYIDGNGRGTKTILLNIQNKDYLCNKGDTIANILIKDFYGDSILLIYNDEEKTLKK